MYLFFYMELVLNDFEAGKSITRGIGRVGPWSEASAIWAQKSIDFIFQGPTLPMALVMDIARLKIIT